MTEEAKVFREEVREKSLTARSARNKNARSKQGPRYSAKQLEALNGPVSTYNLNAPMAYQALIKAPQDIQKKYLEGIIAKYKVGAYVICQALDCSGSSIARLCDRLNIKTPKYTAKEKSIEFLKDFGKSESKVKKKMQIQSSTVSIMGAYNADDISAFIKSMFPAGENVKVTISIEVI